MGALQVVLGLYATVLPFAVLGAWIAVGLHDVAGRTRSGDLGTGAAVGWAMLVLVVPLVGAAVYLLAASRLPRWLAGVYVGGGVAAWLVMVLLTSAIGAAG